MIQSLKRFRALEPLPRHGCTGPAYCPLFRSIAYKTTLGSRILHGVVHVSSSAATSNDRNSAMWTWEFRTAIDYCH